jgi:hypothetical protein
MTMATMQKIPPWATTFIVGIAGFMIVMFVGDIRDEIRQMRGDIKVISELVAGHSARISNLEKK